MEVSLSLNYFLGRQVTVLLSSQIGNCIGTRLFQIEMLHCSYQIQHIQMTITIDFVDIEKALLGAKSKEQLQKVQCIWLKLLFSFSSSQIASAIGWKSSSVRNVQANFRKHGVQVFQSRSRGGRKRENMSFDREVQILNKFVRRVQRGFALDLKGIKKAYELSLGRQVPRSTIYRLISRHGLRHYLSRARST
jgi:transposase